MPLLLSHAFTPPGSHSPVYVYDRYPNTSSGIDPRSQDYWRQPMIIRDPQNCRPSPPPPLPRPCPRPMPMVINNFDCPLPPQPRCGMPPMHNPIGRYPRPSQLHIGSVNQANPVWAFMGSNLVDMATHMEGMEFQQDIF